eukprot:905287-Pleurochrysis_carterae.AAC.2
MAGSGHAWLRECERLRACVRACVRVCVACSVAPASRRRCAGTSGRTSRSMNCNANGGLHRKKKGEGGRSKAREK